MKNSEEWRYKKLHEIAVLIKGRTPSRQRTEYYAKKGVPWVKIENLKRRMISDSEEYLSVEGERVGRTVPADSVLLSVNRTIGRLGIAGVPLQTNEQIVAITIRNTEEVLPEYLYFYLMFSDKNLQKRAYVTINSRISPGVLGEMIIPIAPPKLQQYWVIRLKQLEELIWKKEDMLAQCRKYQEYYGNRRVDSNRNSNWKQNSLKQKKIKLEMEKLGSLLEASTALTEKLLRAVLNRIFQDAEQRKEAVFYGGEEPGWPEIADIRELDDTIKALLLEMPYFQQCIYRAFYAAGAPAAIHTVLKQVKRKEPSLKDQHIQDAVSTVETFRQLGLMSEQEQRKLYYTAEEKAEDEIMGENGSGLTIGLWGCSFPKEDKSVHAAGQGER